jgi:hypothetical protein
MPVETRELYGSPNGDRWLLGRDAGRVFVRHEANAPSGGQVTHTDIGDFLSRGARNPEQSAAAPDRNADGGIDEARRRT